MIRITDAGQRELEEAIASAAADLKGVDLTAFKVDLGNMAASREDCCRAANLYADLVWVGADGKPPRNATTWTVWRHTSGLGCGEVFGEAITKIMSGNVQCPHCKKALQLKLAGSATLSLAGMVGLKPPSKSLAGMVGLPALPQ